jgi:hypothetical protein
MVASSVDTDTTRKSLITGTAGVVVDVVDVVVLVEDAGSVVVVVEVVVVEDVVVLVVVVSCTFATVTYTLLAGPSVEYLFP